MPCVLLRGRGDGAPAGSGDCPPARSPAASGRRDIAAQFLVEAVTLTGVGGIFGIAFGLGAAFLARVVFDFSAAAPPWSVALGFSVSTAVGLVFGLWPALKAARQDPVEALRYE